MNSFLFQHFVLRLGFWCFRLVGTLPRSGWPAEQVRIVFPLAHAESGGEWSWPCLGFLTGASWPSLDSSLALVMSSWVWQEGSPRDGAVLPICQVGTIPRKPLREPRPPWLWATATTSIKSDRSISNPSSSSRQRLTATRISPGPNSPSTKPSMQRPPNISSFNLNSANHGVYLHFIQSQIMRRNQMNKFFFLLH